MTSNAWEVDTEISVDNDLLRLGKYTNPSGEIILHELHDSDSS
jgi:hypothetical protein